MDAELVQIVINLGGFFVLIVGAYLIGSYIERSHFKLLLQRERESASFPTVNFETLPPTWEVHNSGLVTGSVVISLDYFKRIVAGLKAMLGGRIKTYEPLLDRARREAMLRMKDQAAARGFDAVINVRMETSRLASSRSDGKGIAGIEILCFGTGIKRS